MVRKGVVIEIDTFSNSGVIRDSKNREFFFNIDECDECFLPKLGSSVTFVKDPDYKSTNVACLVKQDQLLKAI